MTTGFRFIDTVNWPSGVDLDDLYVRKEYFQEGGLWVWGNNYVGNLGDNTVTKKSSPVQTVAGGTNWKQVSCGNSHTAAIRTNGSLWSWGLGGSGQMGDTFTVNRSSPVQTAAGGTNWKQIDCGAEHTTAIKTDGTLWLWGRNDEGQLGDNTVANKSSPVQTVAVGANWKQVVASGSLTAAIKTDGTLWLWGSNSQGQLGDNTVANKSSPVQTVAGGTNWKYVSSGYFHAAAIKTDGTLWLWGSNYYGQLGDNTIVRRSSPVQTVAGGTNWKKVACGTSHTSAIKTDGTLWLWGLGGSGQMGDTFTANRSSPVQTAAGGTNWKQVSIGAYHTAAIKTDGTLWTWGFNTDGELGDNTTVNKSSPTQTVTGGSNWKQVDCGQYHTAATKYDG